MIKKQKAFTLIEIIVVVAIIGILFTLSLVSLTKSRSEARDSKRVADMKQVFNALDLFMYENGRYPTEDEFNDPSGKLISPSSGAVLIGRMPEAPTPADGDCTPEDNNYTYEVNEEGNDYKIIFCTGKQASDFDYEVLCITPIGLADCAVDACGDEVSFSYDSEEYEIVAIGDQCWMAENLKYLPAVSPPEDGSEDAGFENDPFYYIYNYNGTDVTEAKATENYQIYGALYNHNAALTACPTGWHLPTHEEFVDLERAVCTSGTCETDFPYSTSVGDIGTDEGSKLSGGYSLWYDGNLRNNVNFGNSGFNALPSSFRNWNSSFSSTLSFETYFWSASLGSSAAWNRGFSYSSSKVYRGYFNFEMGLSVRCVKDN
jgi:uncharacterized protein (TIGR02145 family)/prepilin-type N-terminal cleavage/methylation domain-containing protein